MIEKQAIFDVLLDSRAWGEKWIVNPFPYIEKDITLLGDEKLKEYKKHFFISLKKYQAFRDRIVQKEAYEMLEDERHERLGNIKVLPRA